METQIFSISKDDLSNWMAGFSFDESNKYKSLGTDKLLEILNTSMNRGIDTNEGADLRRRIDCYGKNTEGVTYSESPLKHLWASFKNKITMALTLFSLVSIIIESIEYSPTGWVEGVTIAVIILVTCLIYTVQSYTKYRRQQELTAFSKRMKTMTVLRNNEKQQIFVHELLVGDMAYIQEGSEIHGDGLLVEGGVSMDESSLTGEVVPSKKYPMNSGDKNNGNPFIYGGTRCIEGNGLMVITSVGEMKQSSKILSLIVEDPDKDDMKIKRNTSTPLTKIGVALVLLVLVVYIIHFIIRACTWKEFSSIQIPLYIIRSLICFTTIIIIAVPDGIALAFSVGLAYTAKNLTLESCLVRKLESIENLGYADEVLIEKAGILTELNIQVSNLFFSDKYYDHYEYNFREMGKNNTDLLAELICVNTDPKSDESNASGFLSTEHCIVKFAQTLGYDPKTYRPSAKVVKVFPFSGRTKRRLTIYKKTDSLYRIIVYGAFERFLDRCHQYHSVNGVQSLDANRKNEVLEGVMKNFFNKALRTLALCYRDVEISNPTESPEFWPEEELDKELTFFAILVLKFPLKYSVLEAINTLKRMGITTRIISGDNKLASVVFAEECGILPPQSSDKHSQEAMEGCQFSELTSDLTGNIGALTQVKVLARAPPNVKFDFVNCLKSVGKTVIVVSNNTADAPAVKAADIGFSCGISGSDLVKEASDIIILNDSINSIVRAILLGRNLFDICRRTIYLIASGSFAVIGVSFIGIIIHGEAPFYSVQILWISLFLAILAYFSLVSEPPSHKLIDRKPFRRGESFIDSKLLKLIGFQFFNQTLLMSVLLVISPALLDIQSSDNNYPWKSTSAEQYTMTFNSFFFLQIFNTLNAKNLWMINPFLRIFKNKGHIISNIILVTIHVLLIQFGNIVSRTAPLSITQYGISLLLGFLGLISGVFGKVIFGGL